MHSKRKKTAARMMALAMTVLLCLPVSVWAEEGTAETVPVETATPEPTPTPMPITTNDIPGWPQAEQVSADTACLMDINTGAVLYDKAMTQKMYPASTTKIMTALIALENSTMDEKVVFTETGVAEAYAGSSNLYTNVGEEFTMKDCLYALLMKSANDFASQIAEHVGGSVENFTKMMNDRAAAIGCVNTHFNNAHGLPDENHYSCAYDMALILREASKNPEFCTITAAQTYTIPATAQIAERNISSHNALIMPGDYYYEWALGGKTGYTDAARNTLVSFAEKDGLKLVASTMHSPISAESFVNAKILYEYGFNNFKNMTMENGEGVYSGGMVTLPKDASDADVDVAFGDTVETADGQVVNEIFTYNDYEVGQAQIEKTAYDERMAEELAANATPTQEPSPTDSTVVSTGNVQDNDGLAGGLITVPHILIAVMTLLILIGIIAIIVTLVKRKKH